MTSRTFTTAYGYDAAANRTSFTDPESGSTAYVYDTLNRLQTLTPPAAISSGSFGFSYDVLSRRTRLTRPNNVTTNYSYDPLSRLLSVLHQLSGSTIDGATYTVDNAGNRTSKTDNRTGVTTNYGYDNIYQLLSATQGANTTESYIYDAVGNRLSSATGSYGYNNSNEINSAPGATFAYDNNGNTTSKTDATGTTNYSWDFENRLTSVTLPGSAGTVTFKYDPFGRRIYKSSSAGTSIFAYDQGNVIEEVNGSGAVVARYADTLHIDDPLTMLRSSTTSYYETDGLGTVTSLSNAAGALAQTYTLDSFGNQTASSGSLTNPFRFAGRDFDTETSLYYYRARYYDPKPGRFLSEDPLGFGQGVNFYAYVANNPINWIDPTGLATCCPTKEQDDIQKGADNARRRLDHLRDFGTAVLPTDTAANIGAMTGCIGRIAILPNGQRVPLPSEYPIQVNVDPKKHPCNYDCTLKHEMVHQRMCNSLGATKFGALSEAQIEIPAYMRELGCYLKMQMDNNLGPYK